MNGSESQKLKLAVLISGGGTTLQNLIEKITAGNLHAEIVLVVSSDPSAKGRQFADQAGIGHTSIDPKDYASKEQFSDAIFDACRLAKVDIVVMGGFLKHVLIPKDFENRVTNIHPSLIPAFCGKGFYGLKVHQAVLDYGVKVTGCTVHFVDNEYDHGPIILQRALDVRDDDTAETLHARVFALERGAYCDALQAIATGRIAISGRIVKITQ